MAHKPTTAASATKVHSGGLLNLESAVRFLQIAPVEQLDGLYEAICAALARNDSGPARRGAHKSFPIEGPAAPGGSIRGILNYVEKCSGSEAVANLQTLEAVIRSRHSAAGYKPKKSNVGEPANPFVQPKGPQGKKDGLDADGNPPKPKAINVLNPDDKEGRVAAAQ